MSDEFYIGYEGPPPAGMRRAVRLAVAGAIALGLGVAGLVTVAQRPLPKASFEYGRPRPIEGWLTMTPAPALLVPNGEAWDRYWLVAPGKFGAERLLTDQREGWVRLEGTLASRESWRILEIVPGSIARLARDGPPPARGHERPTPITARGEIVDSKCFLGVMNPGSRTAHRDCAVRCLSGGIPAMFSYQDAEGRHHLALVVTRTGVPPGPRLRHAAGTALELSGDLVRDGDLEVLVVPGS